jgi:hypothetical protein
LGAPVLFGALFMGTGKELHGLLLLLRMPIVPTMLAIARPSGHKPINKS